MLHILSGGHEPHWVMTVDAMWHAHMRPAGRGGDMRRAGLGEAGEERTFGETLTCTPKKSTALKIERLDLEGHLQGRGHGALPGVCAKTQRRASHLIGRYSQVRIVFLHGE